MSWKQVVRPKRLKRVDLTAATGYWRARRGWISWLAEWWLRRYGEQWFDAVEVVDVQPIKEGDGVLEVIFEQLRNFENEDIADLVVLIGEDRYPDLTHAVPVGMLDMRQNRNGVRVVGNLRAFAVPYMDGVIVVPKRLFSL